MAFLSTLYKDGSGITMVGILQVLVIIGLVVGTYLMGGEIRNNASTIMVINRVKDYDSAARNFVQLYGALPGDIRDPHIRVAGCVSLPCATPGNGNKIVADKKPLLSTPYYFRDNSENRTFWLHMAVAKLIKGIKEDGTQSKYFGQWGVEFPKAPWGVNGGFHIAYYNVIRTSFNPVSLLGHYMVMRGSTDTYGINIGPYVYVPKLAEQVDKKIDDGIPQTGRVVAAGSDKCIVKGQYNQQAETRECNLLFQLSF